MAAKAKARAAGAPADETVAGEPMVVEAMGIRAEIDQGALDDFEILEAMDELERGNVLKVPFLLRSIFGDGWGDVERQLRDERGKLTASKATEFLLETFQSMGDEPIN